MAIDNWSIARKICNEIQQHKMLTRPLILIGEQKISAFLCVVLLKSVLFCFAVVVVFTFCVFGCSSSLLLYVHGSEMAY